MSCLSISLSGSELAESVASPTALKTVQRLISADHAFHSVLLCGASGSGVAELKQMLVSGWMCTATDSARPCGECYSCRTLASGTNPDFQTIGPSGKGQSIRIADILETADSSNPPTGIPVLTFIRTRPLAARVKVIHFDQAEKLNSASANAVLKTIEEPPPHAKFVLTTDSPSRILPTILSRCLVVMCGYELGENSSDSSQEFATVLSAGVPGELSFMLEHQDLYRRIWDFANSLPKRKAIEAFKLSEEAREFGEEIGKVRNFPARQGQLEFIQHIGTWARVTLADSPETLSRIAKCHRRIAGNVNAGLEFDALFSGLLGQIHRPGTRLTIK